MDLSRLGTALVTRWGAATDAGPVRRRNEDSWLAEPPLYAVADGMGGHADGAAASATALHRLAAGMRPGAVAGAGADLVDLDQEGVAVAVQGHGPHVLVVAGGVPLAPVLPPGAGPEGHPPLGQGATQGLVVHPPDHEDLAGVELLDDGAHQAGGVPFETGRQGGGQDGFGHARDPLTDHPAR